MGEVYRARDNRLDRTVAVKILPAEFAADARLLARFEREAKAISALNHPNICTVHDVGRENGVNYLVMEYCEGITLADLIEKGPLPLRDVLRYGIEIAGALDKVHRQGIIHRDLKPANIMITKSGVKLLDFGLARHGIEDVAPSASAMSTFERPVTEEGHIVGTVHYMAPEVLKAASADARSDIFALGAVLYEMVTGKRAFAGNSKADVIAAIIFSEPPPLSTQQPALDHVIAQCLRKDSDERWQTAHDVAAELRWIQGSGELVAAATRKRHRTLPLAAAIALLLGIAASVTWLILRERAAVGADRFELQPPQGVRVAQSGAQSILAISPDGEWVAFQGASDEPNRRGLYLRSTKELGSRFVAAASNPFFSPDSKWLGFTAEGAIQKVPVQGGEPQKICDAPRLRGATWGDDGTILFSMGEGLLRVLVDGGKPVAVTKPKPGERHYWPDFLPGSDYALITVHAGATDSFRRIAVVSLKSGDVRTLMSDGSQGRYLRNGYLVYGRLGQLYAVNFDTRNLRITGQPKRVLDDVYSYSGSGFTAFAVSATGSLVYIPGADRVRNAELVWVDRQGHATPLLETRMPYDTAAISPDGKRLAVAINSTLEDSDLWLYDLRGRVWTRLTFGQRAYGPVWSPDGRWLVYLSVRSGHQKLSRIRTEGSADPEQLTSGVEWDLGPAVSPDGRVLMFSTQRQAAQWDLVSMSFERPGEPKPFLATSSLETNPRFSPDGRWIAYESDESGSRQIHVRPYPGPGPSVRISTDGGWTPLWSHDGTEIIYQKPKEIWSVAVTANVQFKTSEPKLLFKEPFMLDSPWDNSVDISADGTRFLMVRKPPEANPERRLVYVPNWSDEVRGIYARKK